MIDDTTYYSKYRKLKLDLYNLDVILKEFYNSKTKEQFIQNDVEEFRLACQKAIKTLNDIENLM